MFFRTLWAGASACLLACSLSVSPALASGTTKFLDLSQDPTVTAASIGYVVLYTLGLGSLALLVGSIFVARHINRVFGSAAVLAIAAIALMTLTLPALAQGTTVDLKPLWDGLIPYIVSAIGGLLTVLVGWVLNQARVKLGISIDDSMRDSLQTAARNAAGLVLNKLGNVLPGEIHVGNPIVREAAQYVANAAPDAIKHFGLTPEAVAQRVLALLPQVASTPAPAVVIATEPAK